MLAVGGAGAELEAWRARALAVGLADRIRFLGFRDDVPTVLAGLGTSILTTSRGVMSGREAIKVGVGGEVLCNIW